MPAPIKKGPQSGPFLTTCLYGEANYPPDEDEELLDDEEPEELEELEEFTSSPPGQNS